MELVESRLLTVLALEDRIDYYLRLVPYSAQSALQNIPAHPPHFD